MDPIILTTKPDSKKLPGFWEPKYPPTLEKPIRVRVPELFNKDEVLIIENALTKTDCESIIKFMEGSPNFASVGVQGMMDKNDQKIGSTRTSVWCPELAENIWNKIFRHVPCVLGRTEKATDWWQSSTKYKYEYSGCGFEPIAVSPLLRFMKYENGGEHFAHYDSGFIYQDERYRTLKSMVIYLTTNKGAATRFIEDGQSDIPIWDRNHSDWSRRTKRKEIIAKSECVQGNILLFDHRLCHDVQKYTGNDTRMIIRGDIVYKHT